MMGEQAENVEKAPTEVGDQTEEVEKPEEAEKVQEAPSEDYEDGCGDDGNDSGEPPAKKRLTKLEKYIQRKEERRLNRKALKLRRKQRRREAGNQEAGADNKVMSLPRQPKQRVSMADSACKTRVVIDCAYDHLMSFKDVCKLAHQLSNCYATNRNQPAPVQLYITGLGSALKTPTGETSAEPVEKSTLARLRRVDVQNWDVHLKMEDYTELFPAASVVYLCAESPYELPKEFAEGAADSTSATTVFTKEDVYVIGGLVDHNHHQGFCYEQAQKRGHRTARLPLESAGLKVEGRRVLAVLHVFMALALRLSGAAPDWAAALRSAVPPRKASRSIDKSPTGVQRHIRVPSHFLRDQINGRLRRHIEDEPRCEFPKIGERKKVNSSTFT